MDKALKQEIKRAIEKPIPLNMEEVDCIWWMSRLPEAKRYLSKKIAVCRSKIRELELELEVLESTISRDTRLAQEGTATERKKIAEDKYVMSPSYSEKWEKISEYNLLIEDYEADIENISDKLFSVRKIADFIKVHLMYEDE